MAPFVILTGVSNFRSWTSVPSTSPDISYVNGFLLKSENFVPKIVPFASRKLWSGHHKSKAATQGNQPCFFSVFYDTAPATELFRLRVL